MNVRQASKLVSRVPTGITGLDELIQGGFPRSTLILLAGSPGTGKTIASAHFLYHGAKNLDESGIYVSFAERRDFFFDNMKKFGLDFEKLESKGKFKFLDVMTTREKAVSLTFGTVLGDVLAIDAKRLVIDSFSAMAQSFERKIDARIILHMINKLMRQTGCTTLLLVEVPKGNKKLGLGFEEFVADGIIQFETIYEKEGIQKRAVILKMRGTNHNHRYSNIVISDKGISLMPYVT
jgi:circadian clock protein KaiC